MKLLLLVVLGIVAVQAQEKSQVLTDFSVGYNQFTSDIYKELVKSNSGNFLVCPISVEVILALSNHGAKGKTTQELSAGLHLPEDKEKTKQIFRELAPHLKGTKDYTLTSANKIYLKDGFQIVDEFKSTAVDVFQSDIQNIDFDKNEEAATEMNNWAEEQTQNKIKKLISPDDLNEDTRAVLINAMYFHGQWKTKFNEELTKKRTFYINNENQIKVDMMDVTENFVYYESSELDAKIVEVPYEGDNITMTLVLPNEVEGLPALEARIDEIFDLPRDNIEEVHVVIPKFTIESKIQFKPIFEALGVEDAFGPAADFSGLSAEPTYISKIIQKTFIEVEEKGTTAAAATAVFHEFRSGLSISFTRKKFLADHPFIFYLKSSAGVLFIGRYVQA